MSDTTRASTADLDDDDRPIGRFLTRREVLALFGVGGVAVVAATCAPAATDTSGTASPDTASPAASPTAGSSAATSPSAAAGIPACVVVPELTEGPYYVDTDLERSDIRADTTTGDEAPGVPLTLSWVVSMVDGSSCVPREGALVDVWHCDALGVYSGVAGNGGNFLRGFQRTDAEGRATFTTIYPGWYGGRAVHIHFKIRTDPDAGEGFELTSQLFFDDEVSREVYASNEPYVQKGAQDQPNDADGIFRQSDGTTLLDARRDGGGYAATFSIALRTT